MGPSVLLHKSFASPALMWRVGVTPSKPFAVEYLLLCLLSVHVRATLAAADMCSASSAYCHDHIFFNPTNGSGCMMLSH